MKEKCLLKLPIGSFGVIQDDVDVSIPFETTLQPLPLMFGKEEPILKIKNARLKERIKR